MESLLDEGNRLVRETLRQRNPALAAELEALWVAAQTKIHQFQEGKTSQGTLHCLRVESNLGMLLHNKLDKFKDIDLFILSAAAAVHDIGRIRLRSTLDDNQDHGEVGKELLLDNKVVAEFFQDRLKASTVADIVGTHCNGRISDLPEEPRVIGHPPGVQLRSLAAIFRLADMLDTDYRRCPYVLQGMRFVRFIDDPDLWIARGHIGGWDFAKDGKTILLQMTSGDDNDKRIARAYVEVLNDTISESQRLYLASCPVLYWDQGMKQDLISFPFRFQLDTSQIDRSLVDTTQLHSSVKKEYASSLCWSLSEVDLDGLGEFTDKRPTKLENVFIDIRAEYASGWQSEKIIKISERILGKTLEQRKTSVKNVSERLVFEALPLTRIVDSKEFTRIVLLGDPGSGKSTIAQYLCMRLACELARGMGDDARNIVPFLVTVRELVAERKRRRSSYSIMDYLTDEVNNNLKGKCTEDFVVHVLTSGRSLVIFDGLDEIVEPRDRERIRKEITHFAGLYVETPLVVTSRVVGYEQNALDKEEFVHLKLKELEIEDIEHFVERWYSLREHDVRTRNARITSLKKAIRDPDVGQLAKNPLLLTIMSLIHKAEADLPRQRALLYDKCVQVFLVTRDRAKDLLSYDENEIRACHQYLGYQMQTKHIPDEIGMASLKECLLDFFRKRWPVSLESQKRKVEEFIETARRRVGIIVERQPGVFGFGHRSFQEYFAACYLLSAHFGIEELWGSLQDKLFRPYWRETIKILATKLGDMSPRGLELLVKKILATDPSKYKSKPYENVILVAEFAADKSAITGQPLRTICDALIELWLKVPVGHSDIVTFNRLMIGLYEGPAQDYMVERAREIYNKRVAFSSEKNAVLTHILRSQYPFPI